MRFFITLITMLFLAANSTLAGEIKGHITEKSTGESAVGASVIIRGADTFSAMAGLDGSYNIANVPEGNYTLEVHYVNATPTQKSISVNNNAPTIIDILLTSDNKNQLTEVIIDATKDGGSERTARSMEQKADQLMNIVSAKAIQVSPDLTVANVIQRVSGVSIERNSNGDGQYAIIRGMDKRYNYTEVNGVKIPSPDNKYRYVPLDIFPAELLDRLEVYKALTPSMEGDAIGGAVNMVMKDAPNKLSLTANLATGYSGLFFDRNFQGFDHGGINKQSPYEANGKQYSAIPTDFNNAPLNYTSKKPMPNIITGLSVGNRFFNDKFGVILAGSYQNTYRGANSQLYDQSTVDTYKVVSITGNNIRKYSEQQTRSGLHAKMDYRLNNKNIIKWYNAYLTLNNIQLRDQVSQNMSYGGYDPVNGNATLGYSTRSRITQQHIYNSTLQGEHQISNKFKVDWSAVYSKATAETPDNTTVSLYGVEQNFNQRITTANSMTRRWEHNSDKDLAAYLNLTYNSIIKGLPVEWKLGGLYRNKDRDNFYNNYSFTPKNAKNSFGYQFNSNNEIAWNLGNPKGSVGSALTYKAHEDIRAGYLQFKTVFKQLEIVGGVRVEHTNQGYAMYEQIGEDNPVDSQVYWDVLPSLHLKYMLNSTTNIRASYFRGINRPGFYEIVPYRVVNEDYQERGNNDLKHAVADNFDVRYELFPSAAECLMAGVFYKRIQNPIEYTLQLDPVRGQDVFYGPNNFGTAHNYGFELDFIKFFNKIGFKGNYTYTHSSITTTKSQRVYDPSANGNYHLIYPEQTRPLYGQAAHIANLSLLYKDVQHGWDAQLAANYTGTRIVTVSQFIDRDIWQKAFVQMDFSAEKTFKNHVGIFVKVNNVLNTPMETYIKGKSPVNADIPGQNLANNTLIQRDYYQRSYLVGVRYKL
jgi:hypothetical protein